MNRGRPLNWYTRGARPERNFEAAAFGGLQGFLRAIVAQKPRPWLYAVSNAISSAAAMNKHRLDARARANARYAEFAERLTDAANRLIEAAEANRELRGNTSLLPER